MAKCGCQTASENAGTGRLPLVIETTNRMVKITYIDSGGTPRTVEAEIGSTVMETAIKNSIPGIGAWPVARAAQAVEQAAAGVGEAELTAAVERLGAAVECARSVIAELLRVN